MYHCSHSLQPLLQLGHGTVVHKVSLLWHGGPPQVWREASGGENTEASEDHCPLNSSLLMMQLWCARQGKGLRDQLGHWTRWHQSGA